MPRDVRHTIERWLPNSGSSEQLRDTILPPHNNGVALLLGMGVSRFRVLRYGDGGDITQREATRAE